MDSEENGMSTVSAERASTSVLSSFKYASDTCHGVFDGQTAVSRLLETATPIRFRTAAFLETASSGKRTPIPKKPTS